MNDATTGPGLRHARDVMTADVVAVRSDTPVQEVARLLLARGISAVPVVDADNLPVGIVSEGDLIGRIESERMARRDWWLALMGGQQALDEAFCARLQATDRRAVDVMSAPLVTVGEDTTVSEIARLFAIHHIKRVPVVRDARMVGIVSRADLLRVLADGQADDAAPDKTRHRGLFAGLLGDYRLPPQETVAGNMPAPPQHAGTPGPAAADFRHLAQDHHQGEAEHRDADRRAAARQRRERVRALVDAHLPDATWLRLMHAARTAAENGEPEIVLLRFPSELCIDNGRAINTAAPGWASTLRGQAAEIYLRWERDLKPHGFTLEARVLDFPDGKPGDIGLFLLWGE
ncbi:MAG: CBS domain-containing protein [Acetobacteraceae bacterium]